MKELRLTGTYVNPRHFIGTVKAEDLVAAFTQNWIPDYQRDRVMSKHKIASLISIFEKGQEIDAIKVNYTGPVTPLSTNVVSLTDLRAGFALIDGLQRVLSLQESRAEGLLIPVEFYFGLSRAEEINLFKQFNKLATKLAFQDLVKSSTGTYGKSLQVILKDHTFPLRITPSKTKYSLGIAPMANVYYMLHKRICEGRVLAHPPSPRRILDLLDENVSATVARKVEKAARNIVDFYANVFGDVDWSLDQYRPAVVGAVFKMLATQFINESEEVDTRGLTPVFKDLNNTVFKLEDFQLHKVSGGKWGVIHLERLLRQELNKHLPLDAQLEAPKPRPKYSKAQDE